MRRTTLPRGRFRYEHGSYGGPGGYMPSILCYRETGPDSWIEHFCLVKADTIFDQEDSACEAAEKHLAEAHAIVEAGGSLEDFALSLRREGYKSASDFRVIKEGKGINRPASFCFAAENESTPPSDEQIEQVSRVLERVSFVTTEEKDDLILSFAIEGTEAGEVKSLILLRTPKYEFVLYEHERGVSVWHEEQPETEDDLLCRISLAPDVVTIDTHYNRYELDVSRVERKELEEARRILRRMNFDQRFTLELG